MTTLPSFSEFFQCLWGHAPFPWQSRLAEQVLESGWPDLLDLPTGVGKTSALDVALYCLAVDPQRMPRRVVLVVDRRIVVDQGAERANQIRKAMTAASDGPLRLVADALRKIWEADDEEAPFAVAVMRGGMPRDNDWSKRPDQPLLGVSTVDQIGSRLLFRGYGVGHLSASIHAGLLANDTLVLLDEVHLAVPFSQTLLNIRDRFRRPESGLPDRFKVVQMSATAGQAQSAWSVFGLDDADRANPTLAKRITASKRARLVPLRVTGDDEAKKRAAVADSVVTEALKLQAAGAAVVGVVVNRVDTARLAYRLLRDGHRKTDQDVILVTGRMRAIDRDDVVREVLLKRVGPRHLRKEGATPLLVIATQCIEAGADLDFDALVTECASLSALRQRFGRLDRQGTLFKSDGVIVGRSDSTDADATDPVYGRSLAATWLWLQSLASESVVDFGISALPNAPLTGTPHAAVVETTKNAPVLLPAHVDAWAQTSQLPAVEPDIALWLHGESQGSADVQVLWRVDFALPRAGEDWTKAKSKAEEQLSMRRPSSLETITIPVEAARRWLANESAVAIADVTSGASDEPDKRRPRSADGGETTFVALRWEGDDSAFVAAKDIRPGNVLVLPTNRGGIFAGNFDPESHDSVDDVADLAQLRARGVASLLLDSGNLRFWGYQGLPDTIPQPDRDELAEDTRERIRSWLTQWLEREDMDSRPERSTIFKTLLGSKYRIDISDTRLLLSARIKDKRALEDIELSDAVTEDDGSSFRSAEVSLRQHSTDVRSWTDKFARSVGFSAAIARALSRAAWLHDVGKADRRFQRWLVGGSEVSLMSRSELLAKSTLAPGSMKERIHARKQAGYPARYRHELLSLAMAESLGNNLEQDETLRDLVLHLVASHHGWCRPFAPPLDDPEDIQVVLRHGDERLHAGTRHGLARLDRGVADRFWRLVDTYGWWGLAWLEAVVRLADHRASEQETETA